MGTPTEKRFVELSHVIRDGMVTYPGLPAPAITEWLSREASAERYAAGTTFRINQITMIGNTGTYLDAPSHRWSDGADLAGLPLEKLADLPGVVVRVPPSTRAVDAALLRPHLAGAAVVDGTAAGDAATGGGTAAGGAVAGRAVLLDTGWSAHFGTERYAAPDHPYLTKDGAELLVSAGVALVGIDSINIDDTAPAANGARPAHSVLLAAGIPIVEHLRGLGELPVYGFRFSAVPPMFAGLDTAPVRAYAIVD
ncbi:kynurenine formamidase [Micromonospora sp. Llam0]|uniref:cyclase family protein n=1 Tax=Micromonospora sp. Llam0 TaxID=2485143 RepID=UPI000F48D0FA|nr:cyclase family protein [Micromonospora sp. Llam0]ROO51723.1 kynurenine formamidase [Micromonospora sp. Llam0]